MVPVDARYRNGDTKEVDCVPILSTFAWSLAVSYLAIWVCSCGLFRNCRRAVRRKIADFVNFLTKRCPSTSRAWR